MKFSYSWLKDLLKFKISSQELAELLTLFAFETEVIKNKAEEVLDVKVLANRIADCSSHLGLAREISAILQKEFIFPQSKIRKNNKLTSNFLTIKNKTDNCNCYLSRMIKGIKVEESPTWLKKRLIDCGIRPINNLVDAANYVMLETGQPLHIFDYDKIQDKTIIIRQANKTEEITTLENKNYILDESVMVIADASSPLAIAGIKGGKRAEINKNTQNIILESANFVGSNIRQTSQKLKIRTDASLRFEHNISIDLTEYALDRLTEVIQRIGGGEVLEKVKVITNKESTQKIFSVKLTEIRNFLGWEITKKEVSSLLKLLGFEIKDSLDGFLIKAPRFRQDIIFKEDIIGEIARLFGFNKIPLLLPSEELKIPKVDKIREIKEITKNFFKERCFFEIYNYSFISENDKNYLSSAWQKKLIKLQNPTSALLSFLTPTLLPLFLKNINHNIAFTDKLKFFEISKIYFLEKKEMKEKIVLSGIIAQKDKTNELFFEAKGIIDNLLINLGLENDFYYSLTNKNDYQDLFESSVIELRTKQEILGVVGFPNKNFKKNYKINDEVVFWEIFLEPLVNLINKTKKFQPIPKYPSIVRDISLLVKKEILYKDILQILEDSSFRYLQKVELIDVYEGKNLDNNSKSLTFSLTFQLNNRTLLSEEVDKEIEKIYQVLKEKLSAQIR